MVALKLEGRLTGEFSTGGSRNAVVAFKFLPDPAVAVATPSKQERRGGIEMFYCGFGPSRYSGKQERRGGIETRKSKRAQPQDLEQEAGTPWWH